MKKFDIWFNIVIAILSLITGIGLICTNKLTAGLAMCAIGMQSIELAICYYKLSK